MIIGIKTSFEPKTVVDDFLVLSLFGSTVVLRSSQNILRRHSLKYTSDTMTVL